MSRSIWTILGVPADSDRATIRRAYAERLRETHPEDDPEGFKALRAAYEQALALADGRASRRSPAPMPEPLTEPASHEDARWEDAPPPEPEPIDPEAERFAAEREGMVAELNDRFRALDNALQRPWGADDAAAVRAFQAVLASPAMEEIAFRDQIELVLARLIADNVPRSDAILAEAVATFGWSDEAVRKRQGDDIERVLQRLGEWRAIQSITAQGDQFHWAWRLLTEPPRSDWRMRLAALNPGVAPRVSQLLHQTLWQWPGLRHSMNDAAVAWWTAYLSRAQLNPARLLAAPVVFAALAAIAILLLPRPPWSAVGIGAAAVVAGFVPWWLLTIARKRQARWDDLDEDDYEEPAGDPAWLRLGWLGPLIGLPVAALFVPVSTPWAAALVLLALATIAWVQIVNEGGPSPEHRWTWSITLAVFGVFGLRALMNLTLAEGVIAFAVAAMILHARLLAMGPLVRLAERLRLRDAGGLIMLAAWGGLAAQSPLAPPAIPGTIFTAVALLINAAFHAGNSWLRYAGRIVAVLVFVVTAAVSTSDTSGTRGAADADSVDAAMERLIATEPAYADVRRGNPVLWNEMRGIFEQGIKGAVGRDGVGQRIDAAIQREYTRLYPVAPDALVFEGMQIMLDQRRGMNAANCVKPMRDLPANAVVEEVRERSVRYTLRVVSTPESAQVWQRTGTPVPDDALLKIAGEITGEAEPTLTARLKGEGTPRERCLAEMAMMEALLRHSAADVAATLARAKAPPAEPSAG